MVKQVINEKGIKGIVIGRHLYGIRHESEVFLLQVGPLLIGIVKVDGFLYRGWRPIIGLFD